MRLLDNYSIKTKLFFVIISISIISAIFFTLFISNKYKEYSSFNEVLKLSEVSVKSAELIHELQIERGMSAGFLNSKGAKFESELKDQRLNSNSKLDDFKTSISNHFSVDDEDYKLMAKSLNDLETLNLIRHDIDGFSITAIQQIKSHTEIIKSLLDLLNKIKDLSSEFPEIRNSAITLYNFAWYKEYMGQLRATLNSAFVKNKLDMETYKNLTQRYYASEIFYNTFKDYSDLKEINQLDEYEKLDNFIFVKTAFNKSLNSPNSDSLNINAADWFKNITAYIDNLKLIERTISDDIILSASNESTSNFYNLILIFSITLVVLVLIYIIALKIIGNLIKNITIAYKKAIDIAEGII